jgi:hypothetical protein
MTMTTLEASRAVKVVGLFCETMEDIEKIALVLEVFISLHSHDWFSPGFLAFFTDYKISEVELVLKERTDLFIPTRQGSTWSYFPLYTTIKRFESFSNEEKSLR